jgi:two-component system response regulator RegA
MIFPARMLLVDDDAAFCGVLSRQLLRHDVQVQVAHDGAAALAAATAFQPSAILLDLKLGADNGLVLIKSLQEASPEARIVLATGYASIATAVDAIRRGAHDYLPKPFTLAGLAAAFAQSPATPEPPAPPAAATSMRRLGWEHIQRVMADCNGNISAAARVLGLDRRTLQRRLAKRPVREPLR